MGRAHKHISDRCPGSKNLCHPPPSPLINKHPLVPSTPAGGPTPWTGTMQITAAGFPSSHYQRFKRCPPPSLPVYWSCSPELEKPGRPPRLICSARTVCMGKGENGGRERGEQKQQQNRKEKRREKKKARGEEKTVRLACFFLLYHLFSVSRGGPQLLRHMEHKKA